MVCERRIEKIILKNIMLRKPIVRNLDLYYYVCCYIYICTVLYVSVIILCVKELLQIKFCIFEYSREATILQDETFQKQILSFKKKKNCR